MIRGFIKKSELKITAFKLCTCHKADTALLGRRKFNFIERIISKLVKNFSSMAYTDLNPIENAKQRGLAAVLEDEWLKIEEKCFK